MSRTTTSQERVDRGHAALVLVLSAVIAAAQDLADLSDEEFAEVMGAEMLDTASPDRTVAEVASETMDIVHRIRALVRGA